MELDKTIKDIEASKTKIEEMEGAVATERDRLRTLCTDFERVTAEIRSIAGIVEDHSPKRRRKGKRTATQKPRDPAASIAGGASRIIRQAKESAKGRDEARRLAIESASECARKKHNMTKLSTDVVGRIDSTLAKYYDLAA
jgi:hypothetical protein